MSLGILTSNLRVFKNLKDVKYDKLFGLVSARLVDEDGDFSHITRKKTKLELILLSCAVCGIEFCYAAETAFVSPILLKIGVPVMYMTLIWCLSPVLGFFLVPLLGSLSDRCKSRIGRRRPFILLMSAGIVIGLVLVPNGKKIGIMLGDIYPENEPTPNPSPTTPVVDASVATANSILEAPERWILNNVTVPGINTTGIDGGSYHRYWHPWSILFTVLGVIMLDFNCDACQSPCRTYLLDVTIPEDHSPGLSTFTVMAGLGGSLGYVMGGINWQRTPVGASLGSHVRVVFTMVLIIYIVCMILTILSVKEVPLSKLGVTKEDLQKRKKRVKGMKYRKFTNESDTDSETEDEKRQPMKERNAKPDYGAVTDTNYDREKFPGIQLDIPKTNPFREDCIATSGENLTPMETLPRDESEANETPRRMENGDVSATQIGDGEMSGMPLPSEVSLKNYLMSIVHMPRSLVILCVTNLFCWMSLVCYSLYFTDFVGQAVYGGDPLAPPGSRKHDLYEEGVRVGSFGMSLYSLSCSVYSLSIEKLVKKFRAKPVYICSQLVYTVGAILMSLIRHPAAVILLSPCAGIMYATLFTMPYLLVAHYHSNDTFEEQESGQKTGSNHVTSHIRGLGTDVALVSSMVFLAQFLLSACMGSLIHATGSTVAVVVCAAVLSFCGSLAASQVLYLDL